MSHSTIGDQALRERIEETEHREGWAVTSIARYSTISCTPVWLSLAMKGNLVRASLYCKGPYGELCWYEPVYQVDMRDEQQGEGKEQCGGSG